jgi:hypothetical protein
MRPRICARIFHPIYFRPVRWLCVAVPAQEPESPAELPNDAIVVRGGLMEREQTIKRAEAAFRDVGVYGLSVWAAIGMSAAEIVRLARGHNDPAANPPKRYMPYPQMRTSTAGQLRACGFDLVPDSPFGHYLLTIPTPPAEEHWDALQREFGDAEPAPPREEDET